MHALRRRTGRYAGPLVAATAWSLLRLAGCDSAGTATDDMGMGTDMSMVMQPPGPPTSARSVATVDRPLAAVLTPDAQTIYLTAHDAQGRAQLYSLPAAGGTPTPINTGAQLIHPLGLALSPNGSTLYVVDSAGGPEDAGAVYSGTPGGMLSAGITGVRGPAGIAVAADGSVYVSGFDAGDGRPGLFKTGSGGGALSPVIRGAPFSSPSAIAVGGDGSIYVVDATARGTQQGAVIKVTGTTAALFTPQPLAVGFSAGISPMGVGSNELLITAITGPGSGAIHRVDASGNTTALTLGAALFDPATIHRAANVSLWVAVDSINATQASPAQQLGQVYVLTP